jgi:hypothetical protein
MLQCGAEYPDETTRMRKFCTRCDGEDQWEEMVVEKRRQREEEEKKRS